MRERDKNTRWKTCFQTLGQREKDTNKGKLTKRKREKEKIFILGVEIERDKNRQSDKDKNQWGKRKKREELRA